MSNISFEGQVALVTGASRGIGAAIAIQLAHQGLKVIGTATTDEGASKISQTLGAFTGCAGRRLDVNDALASEALVENIFKEHGGLQVLVNNAGITRDTLAMRMRDDDWDAVLDTNLKAVFRMSRLVMRGMMKQRYGRIISITSVVGAAGNAGQSNYAAAKAGVAGMTRALARELGSRNITVNCIAPGFIETDMTAGLSEAQQKALLGQIPLGHLGKPQDIAHAVAFLASPQAAYITGQECDGVSDVLRLPQVTQRNLSQQSFLLRLGQAGGHVRFDESGSNAVDSDVAGTEFSRQRASHACHTRFGSRIVTLSGIASSTYNRCDADNPAIALLHHSPHHETVHAKNCFQVSVEHCIPVIVSHSHRQRVARDAGVIDKHLQSAMLLENVLHQRFGRERVVNVEPSSCTAGKSA